MELRLRPKKSDYMLQADTEALYVLTEHWNTDIDFYKDELKFLEDVIEEHFLWIIQSGKMPLVQVLKEQIGEAKTEVRKLDEQIKKHLMHLEELMENAFTHDEQKFREEHEKLEEKFGAFVKFFRELKTNLYSTVKDGIDKEKRKYLQNGVSE
ncbi:MAG: hypothetical protein HUJ25_15790 [Crocinitomicaceae bacterium]|nr:hypothetical protein [Crocinitomicaceae bacterium]